MGLTIGPFAVGPGVGCGFDRNGKFGCGYGVRGGIGIGPSVRVLPLISVGLVAGVGYGRPLNTPSLSDYLNK